MTIYSFFYNDPRYGFVNNGLIERIGQISKGIIVSFLYTNIWIPNSNIHYYKLFETNNLNGIYFVP